MKWVEKLLEKTSYVRQLKRNLSFADEQFEKVQCLYEEQSENFKKLQKQLSEDKTVARRIIRMTNSLLKKNELVPTKKQIQTLCHEIIKGEN